MDREIIIKWMLSITDLQNGLDSLSVTSSFEDVNEQQVGSAIQFSSIQFRPLTPTCCTTPNEACFTESTRT